MRAPLRRLSPVLLLAPILLVAAGLRFVGIGWGIQHYDAALAAGTQNRTTFNSDEHVIIDLIAAMQPSEGDLRPRFWAWGTFHCYLVAGALWTAELAGVFPNADWRVGLAAGHNTTLRRVYVVGRAVSAAMGVASVLLVFLIAQSLADWRAGAWAASVLAVSPIHVLNCHYLTPDIALSFWLLLVVLATLHERFVLGGLLVGVATAVKASGMVFVPLPVLLAARARRRPWLVLLCVALGYLAAEPYAILDGAAWWNWVVHLFRYSPTSAPAQFELRPLWFYPLQLLFYGIGPVGVVAAAWGLRFVGRRFLLAVALAVLSLGVWITVARYLVLLIPLLAAAAGVCLARFRAGAAALVGALVIAPLLSVSIANVELMRKPHTAQQAADWIATNVADGSEIARTWDRYPNLDSNRWRDTRLVRPFEGGPFVPPTADVVVLDNLSLMPLRPELQALLREQYAEATRFVRQPELFGVTLPEPFAAHDWKYTHPEIRILVRRKG